MEQIRDEGCTVIEALISTLSVMIVQMAGRSREQGAFVGLVLPESNFYNTFSNTLQVQLMPCCPPAMMLF